MSKIATYSSALIIILFLSMNAKVNAQNFKNLNNTSKETVSSSTKEVNNISNSETKEVKVNAPAKSNTVKENKIENSNTAPINIKSAKPYSKNKFFHYYKKLAIGEGTYA